MSTDSLAIAASPGRIGGLRLRNRFLKSATFEGMSPNGHANEDLIAHHQRLARGGVGMTTVAYCAVSPDGRTFGDQLMLTPESQPILRRLTDAVHREGAAASLQLSHCGGFTKLSTPRGPSPAINRYGLATGRPYIHAMTDAHIEQVIDDFAASAHTARELGFDAVELHLGHGYLLSQFISPALNRRRDRWGGDLLGRLRLPLAVVDAVRTRLGPDFPILAKTNLRDGLPGGLQLDGAVEVARQLESAGVDALVLSGGLVSHNAFYLLRGDSPAKQMAAVESNLIQKAAIFLLAPILLRSPPFSELFLLPDAREVRKAVKLPLVLLGGIVSGANVSTAMDEGFEFVATARALLSNPDWVHEILNDETARARCTHCNICIAEMDRAGVRCVLPRAEPAS